LTLRISSVNESAGLSHQQGRSSTGVSPGNEEGPVGQRVERLEFSFDSGDGASGGSHAAGSAFRATGRFRAPGPDRNTHFGCSSRGWRRRRFVLL